MAKPSWAARKSAVAPSRARASTHALAASRELLMARSPFCVASKRHVEPSGAWTLTSEPGSRMSTASKSRLWTAIMRGVNPAPSGRRTSTFTSSTRNCSSEDDVCSRSTHSSRASSARVGSGTVILPPAWSTSRARGTLSSRTAWSRAVIRVGEFLNSRSMPGTASSSATTSRSFLLMASCRQWFSEASRRLTVAGLASSFTHSGKPSCTASHSAVVAFCARIVWSAPRSARSCVMATSPFCAARCSAVDPSTPETSTSAFLSSRKRTASRCPPNAASTSGW